MNTSKKTIAALILAAGKGKRMQLPQGNKVTVSLADKPLIQHIVDFMKEIGVNTIVVVVGHHKESVMSALKGQDVLFAEQENQLGTGDAVACGLASLPSSITDVIVAYGDDAVLYAQKNVTIVEELIAVHQKTHHPITFLTIDQKHPVGMGRVVRDDDNKVKAIVEEKDATDEERKITEINPGCYVFSVAFLKAYLPTVPKSSVTGEYYVTSLVDMAIAKGEQVDTVQGGTMQWKGVNTPTDLAEATALYQQIQKQ